MSSDLEAGVQIGDFRIERRIGAGGMGIVYLAKQVSLDRLVALKVLGTALTDRSDIARFRREAQAVARLDHPGIAVVHFVGQDGQVCYIAMEFIDGASLREVVTRLASSGLPGVSIDNALEAGQGEAPEVRFDRDTVSYTPEHAADDGRAAPVPPVPQEGRLMTSPGHIRRCCEVVRDAAMALAHAHERGVVHRDIKPGNILLAGQGTVHLIDFGLARFFEDVSLTATGALVGTPMYMSPEQVTGRLQVDHRTDIYSLGMVLYELLTLRRPITAPTREGVLRQVVTKSLPPVSVRNRAVPRALECVVHQATAKDPDERYQSALALARDIDAFLDGKRVEARPYRHRLDTGEIEAERPFGVVLVSALFLVPGVLLSVLAVMLLFFIIQTAIFVSVPKGVPASEIANSYIRTAVFLSASLCLSLFHIWVGRGLLLGKKLHRFLALTAYSAYLLLLAGRAVINAVGDDYDIRHPATMGSVMIPLDVSIVMAIVVFTMAGTLWSRRSREWFSMAGRLRAEHKRGSTGPG